MPLESQVKCSAATEKRQAQIECNLNEEKYFELSSMQMNVDESTLKLIICVMSFQTKPIKKTTCEQVAFHFGFGSLFSTVAWRLHYYHRHISCTIFSRIHL